MKKHSTDHGLWGFLSDSPETAFCKFTFDLNDVWTCMDRQKQGAECPLPGRGLTRPHPGAWPGDGLISEHLVFPSDIKALHACTFYKHQEMYNFPSVADLIWSCILKKLHKFAKGLHQPNPKLFTPSNLESTYLSMLHLQISCVW